MKLFHNFTTFFIIFVSIFISLGVNEVFATSYITQINSDSNAEKIKKLQNIFLELGLYNSSIDGKFNSIKDDLVNYQIKNNIIPNSSHEEAGYFGRKTINSLEENYGQKFLDLKEKYLKHEELEQHQEGLFTVTAYYTPVRGQYKYQKGSYEADIRLNGKGITASGKKPFAGVFALPRNYKFGTKIYLEGIGVGVVEDRGGAIVNSGEKGQLHDRIDIWTGYGDEGRERAINWGRRKVKGFIVNESDDITIEFGGSKISKYNGLKVDAESPKKENVEKLQELFREVGLYNGEINGNYEDIKDELISYQKSKGINSYLGYFGTKTYEFLEKDFGTKSELFLEKDYEEKKIDIKKEETSVSASEKSPNLSEKEKQKIVVVKNKLVQIFKKKNKLEEKYNEELIAFRKKLQEMIPKMRTEKQKSILLYLVEIL